MVFALVGTLLTTSTQGMNYDWDQTYIVDGMPTFLSPEVDLTVLPSGMTTVEHSIPIPVLYEDMLTFYALSGTGATPTHIVNYGGVMGEQYVWATEDIPNNSK